MHRDTHFSSGMQISCGNGNCCPHGLIFSSSNRVAETYFKIHPMGLRSIRNTCRPELCFLLPEVMLWLYLQGSNWTRTHGPRERNGVSVMFFERLERRSNSFLAVRHWTAIVIPIPPIRPSVCRMTDRKSRLATWYHYVTEQFETRCVGLLLKHFQCGCKLQSGIGPSHGRSLPWSNTIYHRPTNDVSNNYRNRSKFRLPRQCIYVGTTRLRGPTNFHSAGCTLVQSAVLRSHVVCLSVCPSVRLWRWWIVIT